MKQDRDWLEQKYVIEKFSMYQIAKICGVSYGVIRWQMKKFKIKSRTTSEANKGKAHPSSIKALKKANQARFNSNNIIGKKFGRLKVIKLEKRIHRIDRDHTYKYLYFCKCDCGNTKIAEKGSLKRGHTKSCGCLNKERLNLLHQKNKLSTEEALFRRLLTVYKFMAKKRNINWDLTEEKFRFLTKQKCFYCGKSPEQKSYRYYKRDEFYFYNGLDRLDNNKGYTEENCRPCCKTCNYAKSDMPYDEFIAWIKRVNNFMNL